MEEAKKRKPFFVGRFEFRTGTEAKEAFRDILHSAPLRVPLSGIEEEMFVNMSAGNRKVETRREETAGRVSTSKTGSRIPKEENS